MPRPKTARANPALRLALIRQCHVYVSVFVAPTLLFFALTGALQTFRIPDDKAAPVVLQKLARLHKDDVFAVKPSRPKRPEGAKAEAGKPPEKAPPAPSTQRLKWFFSMASVAIAVTTLFGLWMALAYHRRKALLWALLIAGAAAPVLLVIL
ncbi:MAG: hypothetical protein ACXWK0_19840 [Caulobacteraceae bacterium]